MQSSQRSFRAAISPTTLLAGAAFWLALHAGVVHAEAITRGPYLQLGTPTTMQIRWKTDVASIGRVCHGMDPWKLPAATCVDEAAATTDHLVNLTGLTADTRYFYSVGNNSTPAALVSGLEYKFLTSPPANTGKPTRIWVIGDAGTNTASQAAVRNAYTTFNGARETDLWLLLGDNAYPNGSDAEYHAAHFVMYQNQLRNTISWYTLGNHETYTGAIGAHPYFTLFSFPTGAQAGGVASGVKNYFSFDYGNIHFISLDSMESNRAVGGPMHTWLTADLLANTKPWVIAFMHHGPYTKGTHNSDTEIEHMEMRTNMIPTLEQHGVDLVLAGHSHVYERSMLIDGHYGLSATLTNAMKLNAGDGRPAGDGAYTKGSNLPGTPHEGAVYITAGSSGQAGGFRYNGGAFHPAMKVSLNNLASVVLDVNGNRLDVTTVRENATTIDTFTMIKGTAAGNIEPSVSVATPVSNSALPRSTPVNLTANASDVNGGIVMSVAYYSNGQQIGTANLAPYTVNWNPPIGLHRITARATDDLGKTQLSSPVFVSVTSAFDIDGNGKVDALTDGLLALRHMFSIAGPALVAGNAIGEGAFRDSAGVTQYLGASADFDIDLNGNVDALTDGLLLMRYLFGIRGPALIASALGPGPGRTGPQIEAYLGGLIP